MTIMNIFIVTDEKSGQGFFGRSIIKPTFNKQGTTEHVFGSPYRRIYTLNGQRYAIWMGKRVPVYEVKG